ncbi:cyclic nucleotide-binding domain-containing protein [Candidatus Gracilibacteria bacterium]|nr:cyclic nucleotide-binding domain-containing protein [Candidatus Gracilibacteria bacterium]
MENIVIIKSLAYKTYSSKIFGNIIEHTVGYSYRYFITQVKMGIFGKVKKLKIFEGIDDSVVQDILDTAKRENFKPGEVIMEQGDHPNGTGYIVESGSVDVWVNMAETALLEAGDIFGEIALLNEEPRTATIVAKTEVTAIILSQDVLFHMIANDDNSINKEIMRRMEENLEQE